MAGDMPEGLWQNSWQPPDKSFVPLMMTQKTKSVQIGSVYHVYESATDFITVTAASALEAAHKSGITQPARIIRAGIQSHNVYYQNGLTERERARKSAVDKEANTNEETMTETPENNTGEATPELIAEAAETHSTENDEHPADAPEEATSEADDTASA